MNTDSAIQEAGMLFTEMNCGLGVLEIGSRDDEFFTANILSSLKNGVEVRVMSLGAVVDTRKYWICEVDTNLLGS